MRRSPLCPDKPALATYNLKDCELVTRIFHKTEIGVVFAGTRDDQRPAARFLPRRRSVAAFPGIFYS